MIVAGQLIEAAKQLVEQADQLLGGALRCQDSETDDVGEPGTIQTEMNKNKKMLGLVLERVQGMPGESQGGVEWSNYNYRMLTFSWRWM